MCCSQDLFEVPLLLQVLSGESILDYNYRRPQEAWGGKTPMEHYALPEACCR